MTAPISGLKVLEKDSDALSSAATSSAASAAVNPITATAAATLTDSNQSGEPKHKEASSGFAITALTSGEQEKLKKLFNAKAKMLKGIGSQDPYDLNLEVTGRVSNTPKVPTETGCHTATGCPMTICCPKTFPCK